ncbi:MAG: hypothetical protein SangKO_099140 [Sandaracinaceae bacterium]
MLTTARPILEHVPASFLDPVSLADQQAQGVVSLIVVRYSERAPDQQDDGHRAAGTAPADALGPTYDTFVAASGQLLAVARTTADYRFPVMPATALERFIEHRDGGCPVFLSVYELDEPDCARFLETVFYSECLKLHVDGADSAALVAQQIAQSSCGGTLPSGILEVNDFSDPLAPCVRLINLDDLATVDPDDRTEIGSLADALVEHLDGVRGRVLLYDRTKNRAAMPGRTDRAFDLDGIIEQANRLADARRGTGTAGGLSGDAAAIAMQRTAAELRASSPGATPDEQSERVESYLRDRADRPRLVEPSHPHATGLGLLVAELQGGRPAATATPTSGLALSVMGEPPPAVALPTSGDGATTPAVVAPIPEPTPQPSPTTEDAHQNGPPPTPQPAPSPAPPDTPGPVAAQLPDSPSPATLPSPAPANSGGQQRPHRHRFASQLDRLRADVFDLFDDSVGRDRAVAHEEHILTDTGIASPVSAQNTVRYLRALLCDEPPKRWHFFKRSRAKLYPEVASKLLAFHAANSHLDDPIVHEVTKLWTRLHK